MSDKDLSSKLAKGMRRAKEPGPGSTPATPTPAASAAHSPSTAATVSNVAVQSHTRGNAAAGPRPAGKRFAEQADQAPPASLDRPWENLHPKRIWPD